MQQMGGGNQAGQMPNGISAPQIQNLALQNALMQQRNQQQSPFPPSLVPAQRTTPVPRTVPTPQQQQVQVTLQNKQPSPQPPMTNQMPLQPNAGQSNSSLAEQTGQASGHAKYMSRQEFTESFKVWYTKHNVQLDRTILLIGNRQIDPYELFIEVMQMGGFVVVSC